MSNNLAPPLRPRTACLPAHTSAGGEMSSKRGMRSLRGGGEASGTSGGGGGGEVEAICNVTFQLTVKAGDVEEGDVIKVCVRECVL